jgi:protein-tyrosine phosphatase
MINILFICHGNICRSPMAEFVMKDLVEKAGLSSKIYIASAATSTEEIGNPVYPPARKRLAREGISTDGKYAVQMKKADYGNYDVLIGMDNWNMKNMLRITGGDPQGKMHLLLDFTEEPGEVADPWYTRDFETTYRQVLWGCQGLLAHLQKVYNL